MLFTPCLDEWISLNRIIFVITTEEMQRPDRAHGQTDAAVRSVLIKVSSVSYGTTAGVWKCNDCRGKKTTKKKRLYRKYNIYLEILGDLF